MTNAPDEKTYALVSNALNKKICAKLEAAGAANPILFPAAQTEKIDLDDYSLALLRDLANFDWLIFSDVLTVDYFLQILEENEIDIFELDAARVCAVGEAVADRLRFVQLHSDVIPTLIDEESVCAALSGYIGAEKIGGASFLSVKRKSSEIKIESLLTKTGARVRQLEIYCAEIIADSAANARLKALLKGGAIDEFVFSSPEDLIALEQLFSDDKPRRILSEVNVSAIDNVIFQTLKEHGLKPRFFRAG